MTPQGDDVFPDSRELLLRVLGKYRPVHDAGEIALLHLPHGRLIFTVSGCVTLVDKEDPAVVVDSLPSVSAKTVSLTWRLAKPTPNDHPIH
jgi:hypothetical protein